LVNEELIKAAGTITGELRFVGITTVDGKETQFDDETTVI